MNASWATLPLLLMLWACSEEKAAPDAPDTTDAPDARDVSDVAAETSDADATSPSDATDATETDASEDTDASADTVPDEVTPAGCGIFDLTGSLEPADVEGAFKLGGNVDLGLGGPLPDAVIFEFYANETGTFDLADNGNDNYKTCDQCVRFVQDIDPTGRLPSKNFFQKSGTLTIDAATPPEGSDLSVTLTDVEMIEVTIRAADFQTTPVVDGDCYQHPGPLGLVTGVCEPTCDEHVCGSDGCGGVCGDDCRDDEVCHLDGSKCESTSTCVSVTLDATLAATAPGVYRLDISKLGLGAVNQDDFVQVEFYKDTTGSAVLDSTTNRNYSSCNQCFRVVVDGDTELFQRSGSLVINDASTPTGDPAVDGFVSFEMHSVVLEEVLIDEDFNSMTIPNGRCVEITDGVLSSPIPE